MRFQIALLILTIALTSPVLAQRAGQPPASPQAPGAPARPTAPPTPPSPIAGPNTVNVRVDVSVTEQMGSVAQPPRTLSFLVCTCGRNTPNSIRSSGKTIEERMLNVDVFATMVENRILLNLSMDRTPTGDGPLGISREVVNLLMENGKPLVVLDAADPKGQRLTMEVKATILK